MNEIINITELRNNAPLIKIKIHETELQIRVFFSMSCCKILFDCHEQGDSFRTSFAKSVFHMYKQAENSLSTFTENDFIEISDTELLLILNEILTQDSKIKLEYEKIDGANVYEKFCSANKAVIKNATVGIHKSLERMSSTFEMIKQPLTTSINNAIRNIVMPKEYLSGLTSDLFKMPHYDFTKLTSTFFDMAKMPHLEMQSVVKAAQIDFSSLKSALNSAPKVQFPELAAALSNIPKPVFDIQAIVSPLQKMMENVRAVNKNIAQTLSASLLQMVEATHKIVSTIDFSLLIYNKGWSEQRDTLLRYGWFYSDELPEELVSAIHAKQKELSVEDVDKIIVAYFRQNKCEAIKKMVNRWESLEYFICRARIFHEALVNHSRKYFNTSVTLLTIHTEGVITDFVRTSINNPRFKVEKAIEDIRKGLKESDNVSIYEFEVFHDVIERIEEAFNENFKHSNPDATSNKSRHKIAHGHAYEAENEVNSLKRFLYLNEIYYLFFKLSNPK